jgi:hypothetical protein
VVKLKEKEYCTLDETVAELQENLEKAINSSRNQINIIKAQTAIGKTYCYVNLIKNSDKKFIVAVPTNILKEEVYNRLKYAGVEGVVKTASISTLEQRNDEIGEKVRELNSLGAYNDLIEYLKKEAKNDKEYLLDYIKPLEQYGTDDVRVIVTTHKKFLNAKEDFLCGFEIINTSELPTLQYKTIGNCLLTFDNKLIFGANGADLSKTDANISICDYAFAYRTFIIYYNPGDNPPKFPDDYPKLPKNCVACGKDIFKKATFVVKENDS